MFKLPMQSNKLFTAACTLLIVALSSYIAEQGYQFGRFLAGH